MPERRVPDGLVISEGPPIIPTDKPARDIPQAVLTDADVPTLVTAAEASTLAHVRAATIRVWTHRGKLRPVGQDTARRYLYALADVVRLDRGDTPVSRET